jgi:hypothetical protein
MMMVPAAALQQQSALSLHSYMVNDHAQSL